MIGVNQSKSSNGRPPSCTRPDSLLIHPFKLPHERDGTSKGRTLCQEIRHWVGASGSARQTRQGSILSAGPRGPRGRPEDEDGPDSNDDPLRGASRRGSNPQVIPYIPRGIPLPSTSSGPRSPDARPIDATVSEGRAWNVIPKSSSVGGPAEGTTHLPTSRCSSISQWTCVHSRDTRQLDADRGCESAMATGKDSPRIHRTPAAGEAVGRARMDDSMRQAGICWITSSRCCAITPSSPEREEVI